MSETRVEYHRRRAAEEMAQANLHHDDITAEQHRRLAKNHVELAREAEKCQVMAAKAPTGATKQKWVAEGTAPGQQYNG